MSFNLPQLAIPDSELLEWLNCQTLRVIHFECREPQLIHRGRKLVRSLNRQGGRHRYGTGNERFRWSICDSGRQRRIACARMIWTAYHRQLIPPDHFIHHHDEDRFNDSIFNLVLVSSSEHRSIHYGEDDF